jgi:hypothetical protein
MEMARKKKKKIDVNRGSDRRIKSWFDRRRSGRRTDDSCSNDFWSKIENGFKKFLESPFKS